MAEGTFKGRVSIHVESSDVARSYFVVHAGKPLEVKSTRVEKRGDSDWDKSLGEVNVSEAFWHEPREFWVMRLAKNVGKGRYRITLEFEGRLDQSMPCMPKRLFCLCVRVSTRVHCSPPHRHSGLLPVYLRGRRWKKAIDRHLQVPAHLRAEMFSLHGRTCL